MTDSLGGNLEAIVGEGKSWVAFSNGTCVIFTDKPDDLEARALELLREWGPVYPGSPAGDFGKITLPDGLGWVVTGHHNDILTYVGPEELAGEPSDLAVGLLGRTKRGQDAEEQIVVHVEDNHHSE